MLRSLLILLAAVSQIQATRNSTRSVAQQSSIPTIRCDSDDGYLYYVKLAVGTPPQEVSLVVDITEPYLWLLDSDNDNYPPLPKGGSPKTSAYEMETVSYSESSSIVTETYTSFVVYATLGTYSGNQSNTSHEYDGSYGEYVFLDYTWIEGNVVQDVIKFQNVEYNGSTNTTIELTDAAFLSANSSEESYGSLGLAGDIPDYGNDYNYHALDSFVREGIIDSSSYSFYIKDNATAHILVGGVNQDLYDEPLVKFNATPYLNAYNQLHRNYPILPLTSINVKNWDSGATFFLKSSNATYPVLLDSTTALNSMPDEVVVDLAVQLNAYYSSDYDSWLSKCSTSEINGTVGFQFGNVTIDVPISDLLMPMYLDTSSPLIFDDGEAACLLLVYPNTAFGYSILGTSFLKSAYLVVDNVGNNIAIANARKDQGLVAANDSTYINATAGNSIKSSFISSGHIPFATPNNVTDLFTYISQSLTEVSSLPGQATVVITNGEIYTGLVSSSNYTLSSSSSQNIGSSNGISITNAHHSDGALLLITLLVGMVTFAILL